MTTSRRIGAKMAAAAQYVERHPGCPKLAVAQAVGPNGSTQYGYRIVDRAIAAGLIQALRTGSRYELYPATWKLNVTAS